MTDTTVAEETRRVAPYVSFSAFRKLLDRMASEGGPPGRVDRSYLRGMSGGYQAQLLAALRSLGLIDLAGVPTPDLFRITKSPGEELPLFMQQTIFKLYPEVVDLAERNGSAGQLVELFKLLFSVQGSTLEGAIRFYIDASNYAGIPVGAHFRAPTRPRPVGAAPRRPALKAAPQKNVSSAPSHGGTSALGASTQRVALESGGSLVLTVNVDIFGLSEADRTFVFDLVDRVKKYQATTERPSTDFPAGSPSQSGSSG
jgi:hypothetical protein